MLISWARMVPVRARAWNAEASAPAARVRLWEIAAQSGSGDHWRRQWCADRGQQRIEAF
jgi:hypothetical protein